MKREYGKIAKKLETLMPIESTLKEARAIENVKTLLKTKGGDISKLTDEELKLAMTI